jgi:hypothetical protein
VVHRRAIVEMGRYLVFCRVVGKGSRLAAAPEKGESRSAYRLHCTGCEAIGRHSFDANRQTLSGKSRIDVYDPKKIDLLLVDDDPDFRGSVARRFLRRGYRVQEASSGPEALTFANGGNTTL